MGGLALSGLWLFLAAGVAPQLVGPWAAYGYRPLIWAIALLLLGEFVQLVPQAFALVG